jgi:hypothetical protein
VTILINNASTTPPQSPPQSSVPSPNAPATLSSPLSPPYRARALIPLPNLVILFSASLNLVFAAQTPTVVSWLIERGKFFLYKDVRNALRHLEEREWIPLIMAEPGALVKDISRGFELSREEVSPILGYNDLAAAMVRMAEEEGWVGKGVGVKATGDVKKDVWPLVNFRTSGLIAYFFSVVCRYS